MKLRSQYSLGIGGLVCTSLVVLGAALLAEQSRYGQQIGQVAAENLGQSLEYQIEKSGRALAATLAERLVTPLYYADHSQILNEASEQRDYPDVLAAEVVDAAGVLIERSASGSRSRMDRPWVREALESGNTVTHREDGVLHVAAPAVVGGHVLGAALLQLSLNSVLGDIRLEKQRLGNLLRSQAASFTLTGVAIGILLVTLAVMAAMVVADRLSGPVVAFATRARRIGRGELSSQAAPAASAFARSSPGPLRRRDEIGDLARAFDEMADTLRQTTVSKEWFDNVLRSMADMLVVTDADGRIATVNPSCQAELGCDEEALRGLHIGALLPQSSRLLGEAAASVSSAAPNDAASPDDAALPDDPAQWFELVSPSGTVIPVRVSAAPLREAGGVTSGYVFVMQDISDRLAADERAARSLAEKEILLREIHHRVKNNLQIISSMLNLQGERTSDGAAREVFHESEVRIRAMALVHEQLYRSGDLAHVDLARYLDTLAHQVVRYFGRHDCRAEVSVADEAREVSVDLAIPVGLIVNELVANAVQHGFAGGRAGSVQVRLENLGDSRRLTVVDDGAGIPSGFDLEEGDSLGLKLVAALTGQLGGSFAMTRDGGTRCTVEFPMRRPAAAAEAAA